MPGPSLTGSFDTETVAGLKSGRELGTLSETPPRPDWAHADRFHGSMAFMHRRVKGLSTLIQRKKARIY